MSVPTLLRALAASCAALFGVPVIMYAHEVYVLSPEEVAQALATPPISPFATVLADLSQFMFWAVVAIIAVTTLFFMSISRRIERWSEPFFDQYRRYAPVFVRVGVGASLVVAAFWQALFGPELPLSMVFGPAALLALIVLGLSGAMILCNIYVRIGAGLGMVLYVVAFVTYGSYLITYIEFLGAFVFLFLGGASEKTGNMPRVFAKLIHRLRPYRFMILRVSLGAAVMFASLYAKILYSPLALTVVNKYDLTSYWIFSSFTPDFLVLGAALVELLCGLLILLGVEIRHTGAFLAFWMTLSLFYFQEMVWPHIILFGLVGAFFLYGYDKYSLEGRFFKRVAGPTM
jgi:hypothetical protein